MGKGRKLEGGKRRKRRKVIEERDEEREEGCKELGLISRMTC